MQEQILQAFQRNANDEAVALAQQWVEQSPGQVQPLSWLATALRQQGQVEAALAALDQALGLQPDDAVLHLQRATLLLTGRQFEQAHAALERTTELDPNQLDSYLIQAHLALAQRDFERAQSLSKVAARLAPEHPQLLAIDGMVALHQGNADQALALLNQAAQQLPDDARILYGLGFAFLAKDHLAFAEQTFRKVVAAQPDSLPLMSLVADLCLRQGNTEGAAQMLEQMLTAPQGNTPGVRRLAAMIQLQAGQPRAAGLSARALLHRHHCQGQARDAHALAGGIADINFPDLGAAPDMHRGSAPGHHPAALAAQVVGIDFHPDTHPLARIHAQVAGGAAQGFGQHHRGPAMQQAIRLMGARIHRHGGLQPVIAGGGEHDSQMGNQAVGAECIDRSQVHRGNKHARHRQTLPSR